MSALCPTEQALNAGRWIERSRPEPNLVPPCCPASDGTGPRDARCDAHSWLVADNSGACTCNSLNRSYEWLPSKCQLVSWDPVRFCALLGRRKLVMVGDSTMNQAYVVLSNFLRWRTAATCASQISFYASDTLTGRRYGHMNRGGTLMDAVRTVSQSSEKPPLFLVSAGAHIYVHGSSAREQFATYIRDVRDVMRRHRNITFIWKSQNPAGCGGSSRSFQIEGGTASLANDGESNALGPLQRQPGNESDTAYWAKERVVGTRAPYNWPWFAAMDGEQYAHVDA